MKGRTFKLCVLTRWDFNFCIRSSPLRGDREDNGGGDDVGDNVDDREDSDGGDD